MTSVLRIGFLKWAILLDYTLRCVFAVRDLIMTHSSCRGWMNAVARDRFNLLCILREVTA